MSNCNIEVVRNFTYMGSEVTLDNDLTEEVEEGSLIKQMPIQPEYISKVNGDI